MSRWISSSPSAGYPVTPYPASLSASSTRTAEAGVSRPTALPTRECLVGYAVKTSASFLSAFGLCRSTACRTAIPATRPARSGSAT